MRIAITGSSGLIGSALRAQLEAEGHQAVRIVRGAPNKPDSTWDPTSGWIREGAFEGVDAVVHLAGESIGEGRWTPARRKELLESRTVPTRLLVAHLAAMPTPPALVCASAVGYYGDRGDEILDEQSARGSGFLSDVTAAWEQAANGGREAGVRTSIVRFGVVLSRDGGAFPRMLLPFRFGVGGTLGRGRQWMSWVTLEDAVRAVSHVLTANGEGTFNITAPQPVTNREFTRALAKAVHRPALFPVPPVALRLLIGGAANELLLASQRVGRSRLAELGFQFHHGDIASGIAAALKGRS
ncbi:MAG: TIGR01777 family oxidoreductase [Tepidiformaceae bacterium]